MSDRTAKLIDQLREAPLYRFSEWPAPPARSANRTIELAVPTEPGVYSIWRLDMSQLVYVGRSKRSKDGLRGRLRAHARGKRSGDQFSVYVCDKFVLPAMDLTMHEARLSKNRSYLDDETHIFIRGNLGYRFVATASAEEAIELERVARRGALGARPLLNPDEN